VHLNSLAGDRLQANATIKSGLGCNGSELMEEEGRWWKIVLWWRGKKKEEEAQEI
jgi:hypothetical protein